MCLTELQVLGLKKVVSEARNKVWDLKELDRGFMKEKEPEEEAARVIV